MNTRKQDCEEIGPDTGSQLVDNSAIVVPVEEKSMAGDTLKEKEKDNEPVLNRMIEEVETNKCLHRRSRQRGVNSADVSLTLTL